MRREFVPFDEAVVKKEFDALAASDADKLAALIEHYQLCGLGNPSPAKVDDYGDGLYRLRHVKPAYQGRLLFFAVDRSMGFERLVILAIYKKERGKAPKHIIEAAKQRKRQWERNR